MRNRIFLLAFLLATLLITSCTANTPTSTIKPVWLNSLRTNITTQVAMAIGPDGAKHFIWSETNNVDKYYLVYTKSRTGELEGRVLIEGESTVEKWMDADIAVTDSDEVLIVWHADHGDGHYMDWFMSISHPEQGMLRMQQPDGNWGPQHSQPRIVAYGDAAFVVYEQMVSGHRQLYYRQVRPTYNETAGLASNSYICTDVDYNSIDLQASHYQVSPDEDCAMLHIAYTCDGHTKTAYGNNRCENGEVPVSTYPMYTGPQRSDPVLEITTVGDYDYANVIFNFYEAGTDDRLTLNYCQLPNCGMWTIVDLAPSSMGDWYLSGNPDADAEGATIRVAFQAFLIDPTKEQKNSTPDQKVTLPDIWVASYFYTSVSNPTRITNSMDIEESDPQIEFLDGSFFLIWRIAVSATEFENVYLYNALTDSTRKIFSDGVPIPYGYYEADARGAFAGGIWISYLGDTFRPVPWVSLNAFLTDLPIILR